MIKVDYSIIVPVWNEEKNIPLLYRELKGEFKRLRKSYEIIFVDDGSTDNSIKILKKLHKTDKKLKIIQFRKHYGKSAALSAGFTHAKGNYIITMDGDLQDDPREIPNFIKKLKEGPDLVVGWRFHRESPITKRLPSKIFNKLTSFVTGVRIHDSNCGFKIFRRDVIKELNLYGELHRYIPALLHWNGFHVDEIKVKHRRRKYGKSKFGAMRLIRGFLDLMSVKFLMLYARRPLHLFGSLGLFFLTVGFLIGLYMTYLWFLGMRVWDRPLLILAVLLMVMGTQFISIGLLGEMITSSQEKLVKEYRIRNIFKN